MQNLIHQALKSHRSIRKYKSTAVSDELLHSILECGLCASSYGNMNTWTAIVTRDSKNKAELYRLHYDQEMILQAPIVLTFCSDVRRMRRWVKLRNGADSFDDLLGFLTGAFDAMLAAQNTAIAAEAAGLGICYMGTTLWNPAAIARILALPENVIPVTSMVLGHPDENPKTRARLPLQAIIHSEKYNDPADAELLELHKDRETSAWERYRSMPSVLAEIEKLGIKNVAQYYTSSAKYPKSLHLEKSREYFELLKQQGYWNF